MGTLPRTRTRIWEWEVLLAKVQPGQVGVRLMGKDWAGACVAPSLLNLPIAGSDLCLALASRCPAEPPRRRRSIFGLSLSPVRPAHKGIE